MNNAMVLVLGLIGLLGSVHMVRKAGAGLGIPPQLTIAAMRLVL
jgi:hypothetical protein